MSFIKTITISALIAVTTAVSIRDDLICSTDPTYCDKFKEAALDHNKKYQVTYAEDVPLDSDV